MPKSLPYSAKNYTVPVPVKEDVAQALIQYALDRLSAFEIPTLQSWDIEIDELDEFFQVCFTSRRGASLTVHGIVLTPDQHDVVRDHGVSAGILHNVPE